MITTLVVATAFSVGPGQAATPDPTTRAEGDGSGWEQIPLHPPTERVTLADAWSDGTDLWTVGTVGTVDDLPWIKRCSTTACVTDQLDLPPGVEDGSLDGIDGTSATDIWAVGSQTSNPGSDYRYTLAAHFDGTTWSVLPTPPPADEEYQYLLYAVEATGPDDVWAVGGAHYNGDWGGGSWTRGYSLHWDGTAWTELQLPELGGCTYEGLADVLVTENGRVLASGTCIQEFGFGRSYGFVLEYVDGQWETVLFLRDRRVDTRLGVLTEAAGQIWAVGSKFLHADWTRERGVSYQLDGDSWVKIKMPRRSGSTRAAVGTSDGAIWAVGYRERAGDQKRSVLLWSGAQWTPVRVGGLGYLNGIALDLAGVPWVVGYDMHDWSHVDPVLLRRSGT